MSAINPLNPSTIFDYLSDLNAKAAKRLQVPKPVVVVHIPEDPNACDECRGTGMVPQVEWVSNCERDFDAPCAICEGTGKYDLGIPPGDKL